MHIALHIASAKLFVTCIAPPRGLKPQPEKASIVVHVGIIVLRSPALLSSKRSGHCVFVGKITGLLRHDKFSRKTKGKAPTFPKFLLNRSTD